MGITRIGGAKTGVGVVKEGLNDVFTDLYSFSVPKT
jgi:hypothetical protein